MKRKVKLTTDFLDKLPGELADNVAKTLKASDLPEEGAEIYRRTGDGNPRDLNDAERSVVAYASTRSVDRDREIVMPDGVLLESFRLAPHVLFNHKWSEPPIGHDEFIGSDSVGLVARSVLADTSLGLDIWKLIKGGHLRTSSIGFIPLQTLTPNNNGWGELMDRLMTLWPEFDRRKAEDTDAVIVKSILLEHSYVSVPANPDALVLAVSSKSLDISERVLKDMGLEVEVSETLPEPPEPPADEPPAEPEVKTPKLVARLIVRPNAPVITPKSLEQIVAEKLDLLRGRI